MTILLPMYHSIFSEVTQKCNMSGLRAMKCGVCFFYFGTAVDASQRPYSCKFNKTESRSSLGSVCAYSRILCCICIFFFRLRGRHASVCKVVAGCDIKAECEAFVRIVRIKTRFTQAFERTFRRDYEAIPNANRKR